MESLKTGENQFDKTDGFFLAAVAIILIVLAVASYNQGLIDCSKHQAEKVEKLKQSV